MDEVVIYVSFASAVLFAMLVYIGMLFTMKTKLKAIEIKQDKHNGIQDRMLKSEMRDKAFDKRLVLMEKNGSKVLDMLTDIKIALVKEGA